MAPAEQCSRFSWGGMPIGQDSRNVGIRDNKFIAELSTFVNKEINDFLRSIVVMSDSLRELRISNTHYHKSAQATSQRMERVQNQVTSIHSDLKEQIDRAVQEVKTELRTEFKAALNKKTVLLETYVESKVNEVR